MVVVDLQCDQIWRKSAPCQNVTSLCEISTVYFLFGSMLNLRWQIMYIIGLIFIAANGQLLKKYSNRLVILPVGELWLVHATL